VYREADDDGEEEFHEEVSDADTSISVADMAAGPDEIMGD